VRYLVAVITTFLALAVAPSVMGQESSNNAWGGRAFVTFNVGAQTASPAFGYEYAATLFQQSATAALNTPGKTGATFDVGSGLRLLQNLGVGVTYSRYSNQRDGMLTTTIPNPLAMYRYLPPGIPTNPSTISEQIPLQREEDAVHIQAIYRVPIGSRIQIGTFGGPSYFRCTDDHVTKFQLQVAISPTGVWSVAFQDVSQLVDRASVWGYHAGGSFTYLATRHFGVGMTVRYSEATHTTTNHFSDTSNLAPSGIWGGNDGTTSFTMKHGGIQWNGGVSFHF